MWRRGYAQTLVFAKPVSALASPLLSSAIGEPRRGADAEFMLCQSFAAVLLIHSSIINLPLGKTASVAKLTL